MIKNIYATMFVIGFIFNSKALANDLPLDILEPGATFLITKPMIVPPPSAGAYKEGMLRRDLGIKPGDAEKEPYCMVFMDSGAQSDRILPTGKFRLVQITASGVFDRTRIVVLKVTDIKGLAAVGCYGPSDLILTVDVLRKSFGEYLTFISP